MMTDKNWLSRHLLPLWFNFSGYPHIKYFLFIIGVMYPEKCIYDNFKSEVMNYLEEVCSALCPFLMNRFEETKGKNYASNLLWSMGGQGGVANF